MVQQIKIRTRSGTVNEMTVEELMEVDGRPYVNSSDELQSVRDALTFQQGQIETLMFLMGAKENTDGSD